MEINQHKGQEEAPPNVLEKEEVKEEVKKKKDGKCKGKRKTVQDEEAKKGDKSICCKCKERKSSLVNRKEAVCR